MLKPTLDPRLLKAADFFPYCRCGADVGADHGHLSCYLLSTGKCETMQVTDISQDSLHKAEKLLKRHGLDDRAEFHTGDGLKALQRNADAIAICGMGGHTLSKILLDGVSYLHGAQLIISPQTEHALVRDTIYRKLCYHLEREEIVQAAGRYYVMMLAVPGEAEITEKELLLGPCLMKCKEPEYLSYVKWRCDVVEREKNEQSARHLVWLKEEYERVRQAIDGSSC